MNLRKRRALVRHKIEDAVARDDIHGGVGKRDVLGIPCQHAHVRHAGRRELGSSFASIAAVMSSPITRPAAPTAAPPAARRCRTRADVEDRVAGADDIRGERIADAGKRFHGARRAVGRAAPRDSRRTCTPRGRSGRGSRAPDAARPRCTSRGPRRRSRAFA